jgi:LacI family transcriptional regulator, gluconate utilization system Gnt-I transcriptional repressor
MSKSASKDVQPHEVDWTSRAMPTMDDIARLTGFSQMTVSRAFLESSPIRKETRDKILEAAAQLGYFHNKAASNLASRRSRAFGIILPTLQDSIYLPFVAGAREVFEESGADYLLQSIDYARKREPHAIGPLVSQRVRAILLPSIGHTKETEKLLRSIPIPIIEVGNLPKRPIHFAVGHSDFEAGYVATRHLIETGRRNVAIICGRVAQTSNARDRLAGFGKAIAEAGLDPSTAQVAEAEHVVDAGPKALARLYEAGARIDGLVIAGEIWGAAVLLDLLRRGRRVPNDIGVISIGEVELGPYLPVTMSYVSLPRYDTGKRAARLALALARGDEIEEPIVELPVALTVHEST